MGGWVGARWWLGSVRLGAHGRSIGGVVAPAPAAAAAAEQSRPAQAESRGGAEEGRQGPGGEMRLPASLSLSPLLLLGEEEGGGCFSALPFLGSSLLRYGGAACLLPPPSLVRMPVVPFSPPIARRPAISRETPRQTFYSPNRFPRRGPICISLMARQSYPLHVICVVITYHDDQEESAIQLISNPNTTCVIFCREQNINVMLLP